MSETIAEDGTFKSCPRPFKQIYGFSVPCFISFLPCKIRKVYKILFTAMKIVIGKQDWWFDLDFENLTISAIRPMFANPKINLAMLFPLKIKCEKKPQTEDSSRRTPNKLWFFHADKFVLHSSSVCYRCISLLCCALSQKVCAQISSDQATIYVGIL